MRTFMFLLTLLSCQVFAQESPQPTSNPIYFCIPNCSAHGCFLRCEPRRPTYMESMRLPGIPSFASEQACVEACNCEQYPIGPRLPNGEVSCQEWISWD
jgi:hypothetical protein